MGIVILLEAFNRTELNRSLLILFIMKVSGVLAGALVAVFLPALSSATFIVVTTAAGTAAAVTISAELALLGLGLVATKLGFVAGALIGSKLRGKREVSADVGEKQMLNQVMDDLLDEIRVGRMEGCFERLLCDITARPTEYSRNLTLVSGIRTAAFSTRYARPGAFAVSKKLLEASRYGEFLQANIAAGYDPTAFCEQVYSQCPWTGKQMDQVILGYERLAQQASSTAAN